MAPEPLQIDIITIFPRMLDGVLGESMLKRAQAAGLVRIRCVNLRDFATGVHLATDDRPYGGGPGMVMKPEPVFKAVESLRRPGSKVILMTPRARPSSRPPLWPSRGKGTSLSFAATMKAWMNASAQLSWIWRYPSATMS